jgi:hypothetical protein
MFWLKVLALQKNTFLKFLNEVIATVVKSYGMLGRVGGEGRDCLCSLVLHLLLHGRWNF